MAFNNFRFRVVVRVFLLATCLMLFTWCTISGYYLRSIYLAAGAIILVVEMIWYLEGLNRDIKTFVLGLSQRDFTLRFKANGKGKSVDELYQVFNQVTEVFHSISAEKEVQHRYLEMLVEHLRVGIISYDSEEKIHLANEAVKMLLQKKTLTHLKAIESIDQNLAQTIRSIRTGETRLVNVKAENELLQLSIHASEFRLEHTYYKLISLQNIRNELDRKEMEAWQKLIRVLTHEIMNSVAPITSLSGTLHNMLQQHRLRFGELEELFVSLDKGLEAIKIRSEGLRGFTDAYRKLTRIPIPNLQRHNFKDIVYRVTRLLEHDLRESRIELRLTLEDTEVIADAELIEHVLINILQNAMDAVKERNAPFIGITTQALPGGRVVTVVQDNGTGMDDQTLDKIFIPFYTTKKHGSGIGLAISKQILQLHNAEISVKSEAGKGTEFTIVL